MKALSVIFTVLAVLLSDVMCAQVAYNWCYLSNCPACSAPASTAFLLAIPYAAAIAVLLALAFVFKRRSTKS